MRHFLLILLWLVAAPHLAKADPVKALKVTVLSTMLAEDGIGEWGYAALVEVDGRRILYDTGARPSTVLDNARELGVDLSTVEDVVLSHNHDDHTGGLVTLRRALMGQNPRALSRVHVAGGFFLPWSRGGPAIAAARPLYEATGGTFVVHDKPFEIAPGVWLTGPVARQSAEHNYPPNLLAQGAPAGNIPDDQALVFETADGLVILTGCGHAGIVNLVEAARAITGGSTVVAAVGGLHLFNASDETLAWTGGQLKAAGLRYLLAGHCTGLEAVWRLRAALGLSRATAAYGAVGSTFVLGQGIDPKAIAG
jgi:7,8-dihydropterin-6-yl-methyl-4-(beta-D-ribofuranosyl)aminobenzene 5'-phosphate synthase